MKKKKVKQRNVVQKNLLQIYGGKSVAHADSTKYNRKNKHKKDYQ